jgi:hypothetical protein
MNKRRRKKLQKQHREAKSIAFGVLNASKIKSVMLHRGLITDSVISSCIAASLEERGGPRHGV